MLDIRQRTAVPLTYFQAFKGSSLIIRCLAKLPTYLSTQKCDGQKQRYERVFAGQMVTMATLVINFKLTTAAKLHQAYILAGSRLERWRAAGLGSVAGMISVQRVIGTKRPMKIYQSVLEYHQKCKQQKRNIVNNTILTIDFPLASRSTNIKTLSGADARLEKRTWPLGLREIGVRSPRGLTQWKKQSG